MEEMVNISGPTRWKKTTVTKTTLNFDYNFLGNFFSGNISLG